MEGMKGIVAAGGDGGVAIVAPEGELGKLVPLPLVGSAQVSDGMIPVDGPACRFATGQAALYSGIMTPFQMA
jgi:hypothetical protein